MTKIYERQYREYSELDAQRRREIFHQVGVFTAPVADEQAARKPGSPDGVTTPEGNADAVLKDGARYRPH